ncbi:MAG: ribbon-helix-helix domain-containing protein [Endomicrobia bacterium]|nr:ribbon-helix-helix domain-containing protein [Endomicrobiia bacterium]MCX7940366.1 ribbon-helix-helix domain-containing protein [Endomicrobiia bacterium]MDW8056523.1 ribbon-helix-helix domain-containing protein [Elusimicrobiota bacterium]
MKHKLVVRLPEKLETKLEILSRKLRCTKNYILQKALESFINEYNDYKIALKRLHDKNDKILSSNDFRKIL